MSVTMAAPAGAKASKYAGQVFTRNQILELNPKLRESFNALGLRNNSIPGTQLRRYRRKDIEAAALASSVAIHLPKASTRIVLLSAQEEDRAGELFRLLTGKKIITDFLFMPQVGELGHYIGQYACDMVLMHHSIGRPEIERMCKMMRDISPATYLFLQKPEGASRRWLEIADEELIASPQQALETIVSRLGIAA